MVICTTALMLQVLQALTRFCIRFSPKVLNSCMQGTVYVATTGICRKHAAVWRRQQYP